MPIPADLHRRLERHGQLHLLRWWDELTQLERSSFAAQLTAIDFQRIELLLHPKIAAAMTCREHPRDRAARARSPGSFVRLPSSPAERAAIDESARIGTDLLRDGRVGAILVAGGQGSRLGFEHPKGIYPIGPVSGASLFQILAEQLLARSRRAGAVIPYYIMTSEATHDETVAFFREQKHFGLDPAAVFFFMQGNMPAVDGEGRLLLAAKGSVSQGPDGHGGIFATLAKSGLVDKMRDRGIGNLDYHQVDNPTANVCDPAFLGAHAAAGSEVSTKVVAKRSAEERMGVIVELDGKTQIIEYSNLPPDIAARTDDDGRLLLWAGNTAMHVFSREFLERIAGDDSALPFYLARKAVSFLNSDGRIVFPEQPNAIKFERFIFDALPFARRALVVEADRGREFNPVKNATGADSPETARAALLSRAAEWLRRAGATLTADARVEISPLFALDADEVAEKVPANQEFSGSTYLR